ncbi:hypothetical protein AVEN_135990-1 [Araneus ventricosus]|uniref:Uncharacterized protein n=1 Tax=Araneus ventricosus TaxID=182803 RepID=A0A4Y2LD81_ARAVE|nr:hypothetical protein AVEN_135990-1 [Araneus ventricosus]
MAISESDATRCKPGIDDWFKLNSPDDLVEKLDDYDTLRSTFRSKQPRKEGRHSLLLQIQENNKNVENSKSDNDSLVKTNAYYDKKKSGKVSLRKGDIVAVRRNPTTTGESTKKQPRYRGPMVVTEILPGESHN